MLSGSLGGGQEWRKIKIRELGERQASRDEIHQAARQLQLQQEREIDALRSALRANDKLGKSPAAEQAAAQQLEQKAAELEVSLRFAREELRLERDMLASMRHQVSLSTRTRCPCV